MTSKIQWTHCACVKHVGPLYYIQVIAQKGGTWFPKSHALTLNWQNDRPIESGELTNKERWLGGIWEAGEIRPWFFSPNMLLWKLAAKSDKRVTFTMHNAAHLRAFVFSKAKTTRCATLPLNNFINNNDFKCKNVWLDDFCQKSDGNDRSLEIISLQTTWLDLPEKLRICQLSTEKRST